MPGRPFTFRAVGCGNPLGAVPVFEQLSYFPATRREQHDRSNCAEARRVNHHHVRRRPYSYAVHALPRPTWAGANVLPRLKYGARSAHTESGAEI